jgi:methylmalonyl-CoA mutase
VVLDVPRVAAPFDSAPIKYEPLPSIRLAEPFEALRDASDRILASTGARPKIFLANLGKLADFTARASFAKNFFEAGGIEAVTNDGFANRDEMVAAFQRSGAKLACLCGSDESYAADAIAAATALAAAGARLTLAGRPSEQESALRAAGIETFIFAGCDVLAALRATHAVIAS